MKRQYITANIFSLWVGLAAVAGGVSYFAMPQVGRDSSIHLAVGGLDYAWTALYLIGGIFTVWGLITASPRSEMAGMCLLGPAFAINGTAIFVVHGPIGLVSGLTIVGLALACLTRIRILITAYRIDRAQPGSRRR